MEDLPALPSSRTSSRAPSRQSSSPDLTESHLYIRDFVRETRERLDFTSVQLPILDDHQLSELSDGETILVPLSCSALNALASMTRQLDTITTQLGTIQSIVATRPTGSAIDSRLAPINPSLRDLSQRVSAAPPPHMPAPPRAPVPPTSVTTRPSTLPVQPTQPAPPPVQPRPKGRAPLLRLLLPLSTPTYPDTMRTLAPSTETPVLTRTSSRTPGKQTLSPKGSTPTPPLSSRAISPPTAPSPDPRMPRPPPKRLQRARRIRAPSRPLKSRQPVTPSL